MKPRVFVDGAPLWGVTDVKITSNPPSPHVDSFTLPSTVTLTGKLDYVPRSDREQRFVEAGLGVRGLRLELVGHEAAIFKVRSEQ